MHVTSLPNTMKTHTQSRVIQSEEKQALAKHKEALHSQQGRSSPKRSRRSYLPMKSCIPMMPKTKKTHASSSTTSNSSGMESISVVTSRRMPG